MEEEREIQNEDNSGIAKPLSAFHHYSKAMSSKVKEDLAKEGKDSSMGSVVSVVSTKWRELVGPDKNEYENLAMLDRERYSSECAVRDQEALRLQEERRRSNAATETETRMRGSTMANSDSSTLKADVPKRKREVSEAVRGERDARKQVRNAEESAINQQHGDLKQARVEQAEARLKYLLNQSDIFSHFGVGAKSRPSATATSSSAEIVPAVPAAKSKRGRPAAAKRVASSASAGFDELDEDEQAMARELGDEDGGEEAPSTTVLLKQPSSIVGGAMRSYQLEGLNWMIRLRENGINGILADEMGLGKTLQSISILAYMQEFLHVSGPHLVMVPKSTLSNWMNEFKRWCPSLRVLRFHGSKEERMETVQTSLKPAAYQDERDWDVVITTYEVVNLEKTALSKIAWRYLVIDEAHRLKNEASQFSMTVRMLNTEHRLLLTGTPLQNNLHELWALLNFLLPDVFASSEQFDDWFNLDVDDTEAKQRIISQLHKLLRPFMLRRLKADVEKSLPAKSETILFTGMSTEQKNLYKQILLRDIDSINGGTANGSRTAILNIVMQLRKCCNHPYLFPGVEDRTLDPMGSHLYTSCGKMVLLDKLLRKMKERDHRVLIFSQMTRMLDILEDYLRSRGYRYCRIDGNTSYEDREDSIADYNREGSDKFIFLLSTRAGGLGINLQTADTVILYDSDWNPQADLQAQDRAHRIGQKKPVQVFRLITDESVEVKVVERAQQKLKLDAMVVQQGRLQDKDKKLSKNDLLETIRFGADKVFRSKESTITDDDIDLILEKGRKRTEEMNEKMSEAEKGDMYDFRLDGGMSAQTFEGKDYSDRNMRENELSAMAGLAFIDPGKRERKVIASYSETIARMADENADKKPKIPRHLRLPRMEDWQFYDRDALQELHNEELKLFDEMAERGELPQIGSINKYVVLPPEKHALKTRLLAEAFSDWNRVHYNNFLRAAAKHGRAGLDKIAKDVGRPVEEVRRYSAAFWARGAASLPAVEWERVVKQIEKGEKRLEEIQRLTSATAKLIMLFNDPWEELTFRNVGNQGRIYNAVEDRFLLCLTHLHGYGSWDQVRSSIRRCERFRFDFYLQSCSSETLGKRCELLMRAAERELAEIERKKQAADAMTATNAKTQNSADLSREKMSVLLGEIKTESLRLAQARVQLQKLKSTKAAAPPKATPSSSASSALTSTATTSSSCASSSSSSVSDVKAEVKAEAAAPAKKGPKKGAAREGVAVSASGRPIAKQVPDGVLPELCKLLKASGPDGISKVVDKFVLNHPTIPKRQIELKIFEIAVKEKRPDDAKQIWHIMDEFTRFLEMDNFEGNEADAVAGSSSSNGKAVGAKGGKGRGASSGAGGGSAGPAKRKLDEASEVTVSKSSKTSDDNESNATTGNSDGKALSAPKKFKHAFAWFVKEKRAEAEAAVRGSNNTNELKTVLKNMWEEVDDAVRAPYQTMEKDDEDRYNREMEAYKSMGGK